MKVSRKKIRLIVEKTKTGFSVYSEDYPIFTVGKTITQLMEHSLEACNLYFIEQGKLITIDQLKFEIDFKQFFSILQSN